MMTHQTAAALALLVTLGTAARHARAEQVPLGDFVRVYDKAHLAAHPDQLVREMRLSLKRSSTRHYSHDFILRVKLRGRDDVLKTEGPCQNKGPGLDCIVECDGGGIYVRPRGDGVLVYINDRVRMVTCDRPIEDDDVFRLDRVRGR